MGTSRETAKTKAGFLALICSLVVAVPFILGPLARILHLDRRANISARAGQIIFDGGAIFILLTVIFAVVGFIQGGESRRLGLIGIATVVLGIVAGIGLTLIAG